MKFELYSSNYATKADLENAKGVDTSKLAKNVDLANLKSDVDKLVPVPVDLSKHSDLVKNDVVKKDVYNAKIDKKMLKIGYLILLI